MSTRNEDDLARFRFLSATGVNAIRLADKALVQEHAELRQLRAEFLQRQEEAAQTWGKVGAVAGSDKLILNVGGSLMRMSRASLMQQAHPIMSEIWCGRWDNRFLRDRDGHIFVDLDPAAFVVVRDYLLDCERPGQNRRTLPKLEDAEPPLAAMLALFHLHDDFALRRRPDGFTAQLERLPESLEKHRELVLDTIHGSLGSARILFRRVYTTSADGWSWAEFDKLGADQQLFCVFTIQDGSTAAMLCDLPWKDVVRKGGASSTGARVFYAADGHELLVLKARSSPPGTTISRDPSLNACTLSDASLQNEWFRWDLSGADRARITLHMHLARAQNGANPYRYLRFASCPQQLRVTQMVAYALAPMQDEISDARSALARKVASLAPSPAQSELGSVPVDALGALGAHVASALQQESAALALARSKLLTDVRAFERCEAAVAFLAAGSTADIIRLEAGGLIDVRRSVLTTCGESQSQLARQFASDGEWRSDATVWIEDDSANFRKLVSFLRICSMPPELCAGLNPRTLAASVVQGLSANDRALFDEVVSCYFPGAASAFVLS